MSMPMDIVRACSSGKDRRVLSIQDLVIANVQAVTGQMQASALTARLTLIMMLMAPASALPTGVVTTVEHTLEYAMLHAVDVPDLTLMTVEIVRIMLASIVTDSVFVTRIGWERAVRYILAHVIHCVWALMDAMDHCHLIVTFALQTHSVMNTGTVNVQKAGGATDVMNTMASAILAVTHVLDLAQRHV